MSRVLCKTVLQNFHRLSLTHTRNGHHLRGKPPGIARSLAQRLAGENVVDEELVKRIDISLPPPQLSSERTRERSSFLKAKRKERDLSKQCKTPVNLQKVRIEWLKTAGPEHIKQIADHYGIFAHLFGDAYFYPRVPLAAHFSSSDLVEYPVYFGNVINPMDAMRRPTVLYQCEGNSLWTLTLVNLDGNFFDQDREVIHWMVGNIPGNDFDKGETIIQYLQPHPPKGTGYHRFVFVLYKQDQKLDYSKLKIKQLNNLKERTFSTLEFYRERQDLITPGGLCFFQTDWDASLHDFYHKTLQMKEPIFEYDFDPPYKTPQKWYPIRQAFNLYLDRYRDPKQINKEFLERKLKNVHPFKPDPKPLPYPNTIPFTDYKPTWLKLEIRKSRLKWGRINEIE